MKNAEERGIRMFSTDSMMGLVQDHAAEHVQKELVVVEHVDDGASGGHENIVLVMVEVVDSLQCLVFSKDVKNSQSCVRLDGLDTIYVR